MKTLKIIILIFASNLFSAKITLPKIFGNNMVLQRNEKIPIWGFASPKEKVQVKFKKQTKSIICDEKGNWKILLDKENFGGPFEMKITGENEIILTNILIGDVWLCSGQSNMEWTVAQSDNFETEKNSKNISPNIRHLKIEHEISNSPKNNLESGVWKIANSETIGDFSGIAYFFAKKLYQKNKIPIGLVNSSWGGTNVETWISRSGFEKSPDFKEMISQMPKINLDSLQKIFLKRKFERFEKLQKSKISDFKQDNFLNNDFNDENLGEIYQPKLWENQGLEALDGIIWLRKNINLSAEDIANDASLFLSKIDDEDITYFNGVEVGTTKVWDTERKYIIPKNLLKIGKNSIIIKVTDNGGGGGIYGKSENLKLITSQNTISLVGNWKFQIEKILQEIGVNDFPSLAYNAMIQPIIPFAMKGVIWYQGESNAERATEYNKSFPLLINDWRIKWQKDFPFYFVQLATFRTSGNSNEGCNWAELREAQTNTLKLKNTGMVVTTDIGNPNNIHPTNKKTVGERLANLELKNGVVSPTFKNFEINNDKIIVSFDNAKNGLSTPNNNKIEGFEIAGADQIFYQAEAKIIGNRVVIFSDKISKPTAARFGWIGDATANNLFSKEGLPVSPFRTDSYKTLTKDAKYTLNLK